MSPEWNIKPREVLCVRCQIRKYTDEAGPRCDVCGGQMVTVIMKEKKSEDHT